MKDYRKQVLLRHQPSTYDILMEDLLPAGGRKMSGKDVIERQFFRDALQGDLKATEAVLKMIDANAQEMAKKQPRGPWIEYTEDYWVRNRAVQRVLEILGIGAEFGKRNFGIAPWVLALAESQLGRGDQRDDHGRYDFPPQLEWPERLPPDGYCCHHAVERSRRDAAPTQFQPGRSGNPAGRPLARAGEPAVPFPMFEERGDHKIDGEIYRITRAEAFLLQLMLKAAKGDAAVKRILAKYTIAETYARWRRREFRTMVSYNHPDMPNPFARRLRHLGLVSSRSRKFLLLEGWIVEVALARLGERRLCIHEQAEVVVAVSKPRDIDWPDWWQVRQKSVARRVLPKPPRKKKHQWVDWRQPLKSWTRI